MPYRKKTYRKRRRPIRRRKRKWTLSRRPSNHYTTFVRYSPTDLASNAGGAVVLTFNCQNVSGAQDWSNLAALFDQYRVIEMKVKYFPYQQAANSVSSRDIAPLYCVRDYNDATGLTSVAQALQYNKVRTINLFSRWTAIMRMSTKASAQSNGADGWFPTSNPPTHQAMKFYGTGFDLSQTYGNYVIEAIIQFKNRN